MCSIVVTVSRFCNSPGVGRFFDTAPWCRCRFKATTSHHTRVCMPLDLLFANISYLNYRYIKSCTKHNSKEIDNNIHTLKLSKTKMKHYKQFGATYKLSAILFIYKVTSNTNLKFKYCRYLISTVPCAMHNKVVVGLTRLQHKP